jgi:hypothetical protein
MKAKLEPLDRTANPNGYGFFLRCKFASATEDARSIKSLGEINVSSVFPIPDEAPAEIARRVADRLRSKL